MPEAPLVLLPLTHRTSTSLRYTQQDELAAAAASWEEWLEEERQEEEQRATERELRTAMSQVEEG